MKRTQRDCAKWFMGFGFLFFAATVQAHQPPVLVVPVDHGQRQPLLITEVSVNARVSGFLAEVTTTLVFENPSQRVTEGEFYFPLPPGAALSGFALDVDGKLVDGVSIEKEKARVVFEKEVRKGVDPGLVEWVKGNQFHTRVYPIPAQGTRTIRVRYVMELEKNKGHSVLQVPLAFEKPLKQFAMDVFVAEPGKAPVIAIEGGPNPKLEMVVGEGWAARLRLENQPLKGLLRVVVPPRLSNDVVCDSFNDDERFFAARVIVPTEAMNRSKSRGAISRLAVVLDQSLSRRNADMEREKALVEMFVKSNKETLTQVDLYGLSNELLPLGHFTVTQGEPESLWSAFGRLSYDGGTRVGALKELTKGPRPDIILFFSDGISTFGEELPGDVGSPLYAFSSAAQINAPLLKRIAESNGGRWFDLLKRAPGEIVPLLGTEPLLVRNVRVEGAGAEVLPSAPVLLTDRILLTGKFFGSSATVSFEVGSVRETYYSDSVSVTGCRNDAPGLARFVYAQEKVESLSWAPDRNRAEIVRLGKRFGLVTPFTSMLVLESLDQYLAHEIEPPASLPEIRAAFHRRTEEKRQNEKMAENKRVEEVLALWGERVRWYHADVKAPSKDQGRQAQSRNDHAQTSEPSAPQGNVARRSTLESRISGSSLAMNPPPPTLQDSGRAVADELMEMDQDAAGATDEGKISSAGTITLQAWDPSLTYLTKLKAVPPQSRYELYMKQRPQFEGSPAYYLDCAELFFKEKQDALGLRVLSNLAELDLENPALLRVLGHRLVQGGHDALAKPVFEEVLRLRPEEPQSWRDLGLLLAKMNELKRALDLLAHVVMRRWDRFDGIELIALEEFNALVESARRQKMVIPLDPRLLTPFQLDARIVLSWDADLTDIDLHVIEPTGEEAFYGHQATAIGGLVSRDFTQGYGPEEYLLRKAIPGTYKVVVNFFGSQAQRLTGSVTLKLDLFTHFGHPGQKHKSITVRLTEQKESLTIGELSF